MCGLSCPAACGILVPGPGIKLTSPTLESRFLITGPSRKSPFIGFSDLSGNLTLLAWKDQGCSQVHKNLMGNLHVISQQNLSSDGTLHEVFKIYIRCLAVSVEKLAFS